jgi:DNA-binding response OmpR family regulator
VDINKYKNLLFQKIKAKISKWFELQEDLLIPNDEVYQFLHSIYGTAGTLQLAGLSQIALTLMKQFEPYAGKNWGRDELRNRLDELIDLAYEYENFHEIKQDPEPVRAGNVPLIQIIDDDLSMLIVLKDTLEKRGWMVIANSHYEKGKSQYMELNPDCVIIGIHSQDEFHVLHDLQKHDQQKFVPKIMTSFRNDREMRIMAYQGNADDFIEKSIDLEEFTVRIEHWLNRKKLFDQSVALSNDRSQPSSEQGKKPLYVSIIDDDALIRTMLLRILKTMDTGHYELQLEAFSNGIQFFDSKRLELPGKHFLLLDGVMPIMDGIEVLQKVRNMNIDENLYVLMLTGRKTDSDIEKALKLGADDYLTKPFSIKELQARIQRLIKRMK